MTTPRPDLLTRPEAAAYLGVSVSWLRRHTPMQGGPAWRRLGTLVRYRREDLDYWIDHIAPGAPGTPEAPECPAPPRKTASSASVSAGPTDPSTSRRSGGSGSRSEAATSSAAPERRSAAELLSQLEQFERASRPQLQLVPEEEPV